MSKESRIENYMRAGHKLTPAIASRKFRCYALHSAAARIRDRGHLVKCVMRRRNGDVWGEYSMGRR